MFWLLECACGVGVFNLDGLLVHRGLLAPDSQAGGGMQPRLDIGIAAAIPQDTSWRCHRHHCIHMGKWPLQPHAEHCRRDSLHKRVRVVCKIKTPLKCSQTSLSSASWAGVIHYNTWAFTVLWKGFSTQFHRREEQCISALLSLQCSLRSADLSPLAAGAGGVNGSTPALPTPDKWRYRWCPFSQCGVNLHFCLWRENRGKGGTHHSTATWYNQGCNSVLSSHRHCYLNRSRC